MRLLTYIDEISDLHWWDFWPKLMKLLTFIDKTIYIYWQDYWTTLMRLLTYIDELLTYIVETIDLHWWDYWPTLMRLLTYIVEPLTHIDLHWWGPWCPRAVGILGSWGCRRSVGSCSSCPSPGCYIRTPGRPATSPQMPSPAQTGSKQ